MRRTSVALLLALVALAAAAAQSPLEWEQGVNSLNGGWRTHSGNDPAWATPGFNDSSWQVTTLNAPQTPTPGAYDEHWYRLQLHLPAHHRSVALLDSGAQGIFEVYLNGQLLPGAGLRSAWRISWLSSNWIVPLEDGECSIASSPCVLAVHTRVPNNSLFHWNPARLAIQVSLGSLGAINDSATARQNQLLRALTLRYTIALLLVLAAFPLILLSRFQSNHREYLWIGLNLLCLSFMGISSTPARFVFITLPAIYFSPIAQIEFTFAFAGRPITRAWRVYQGVILLAIVMLLPCLWLGALDFYPYQAIEAALLVPATFILPVLLFVWYRHGNSEAGWLFLPSLLPLLSICLIDLGLIGMWLGSARLASILNPIPIGPFFIRVDDPGNLLYLFSICIVIFMRFNRVSHQQARAAAEWEAARAVQQVLIPTETPDVAGFKIETVYKPASEVGGDFYQVVRVQGGGILVVIGDVSGKGMPAAMTVSLLVGTFRTLAHYTQSPGEILKAMNQRMIGRNSGGFTTCLVLRAEVDGRLTVANAGHIPPYVDGQELALEHGLPLGLSPESAYGESILQLAPIAQITLVTDGVVEARDASGELFGFDRTRQISRQSAKEMADIAVRFGQEDDITVLAVSLLPVAAAV
jgi:sigma-B regulation protein RsbU (phosphoserine phosphatase)